MALVLADRVQEYSTTTGTGTLTLSGAYAGFQTFAAAIGNGNTCYYTISSDSNQWEVGIGTVGVGTLARTTLISSSTGSLVSFTGTLTVFVTYPAEKAVYLDASGNYVPSTPTFTSITDSALTLNRVTYAGTGGLLRDSANLTFDGTTLTATGFSGPINGVITSSSITDSGLTSGRVTYAGTGGLLQDSANLTFNGTTLTTANDATINGNNVGKGGGSVASNQSFGGFNLSKNTTGSNNSAYGYFALYQNLTGGGNIGIGLSALQNNTIGSNQTAIGFQALTNAITAVGTLGSITAGSGYTNGTYTAVAMSAVSGATFVAYPTVTVVVAGGVVTTVTLVTAGGGASSTAATVLTVAAALIGGTGSGFSIPVATFATAATNTAVGYVALSSTTTATQNTAVGNSALFANTTGQANTAVGNNALLANTTGAFNNALGSSALSSNTTGGYNVAVGLNTLQSNIGGNFHSAYGVQALTNFTTGDNNTAVGYLAGSALISGSNNLILGNSAAASTTTVSNEITLGNSSITAFRIPGLSITAAPSALTVGSQFVVANTTSAVNYLQVTGGATAFGPTLLAYGSDTNVNMTLSTKGTGNFNFYSANAYLQFVVANTTSAVNYLQVAGNAAGATPVFSAQGSDTNISIQYSAKGSGLHYFYGNNTPQLVVASTASAVNYLQATGSVASSAPILSAQGSDTNIGIDISTKGSGVFNAKINGGTALRVISDFNNPTAFFTVIGSTGSTPTLRSNTALAVFQVTTGNFSFQSTTAGATQFYIAHTASAVNYLQITGAVTTGSPILSAQGSDTNIDLALTPKGTGVLRFGTYTAGILAQTGYITIKDAGGTTRNLLVG